MTLQDFFRTYNKAAVAFSGGADSAFLLWAAKKYGCDVTAYFADSPFQPGFARPYAEKLASQIGAPLKILSVDVLSLEDVANNPANRCYFCKKAMFSALWNAVRTDGHTILLDGNNASDDAGDRPGMRALEELQVLSPLRLCGLTKYEIRRRSKEAGLPTWNLPAYACLATRIPTDQRITVENLQKVDRAESYLRDLGFSDLRLRLRPEGALLQLPAAQFAQFEARKAEITAHLKEYFPEVALDPKPRAVEELP